MGHVCFARARDILRDIRQSCRVFIGHLLSVFAELRDIGVPPFTCPNYSPKAGVGRSNRPGGTMISAGQKM